MLLPVIALTLVATTASAQMSDIEKVRKEIINTRYTSELKAAKTGEQKQKVILNYSEQMYPTNKMNYGALPPEQRLKYGSGAMSAATYTATGSSSYEASRKAAEKMRGEAEPLNYYNLPGETSGTYGTGDSQLLPPN